VDYKMPAVLKLQHKNSFEWENPQTPKKAAVADGFALPAFLKVLLDKTSAGQSATVTNPRTSSR
jgi:hypothetical protein